MRPQRRRTSTGTAAVDVLLAEGDWANAEQDGRILARDYLTYATVLVLLAIASGSAAFGPAAWLSLPYVCFVLGWSRFTTDQKVSQLGDYKARELAPQLSELCEWPVLRWETGFRNDPRRAHRKRIQLASDLLLFVFAGFAGVTAWSWHPGPHHPPLLVVAVVGVLLDVVLGYELIVEHASGRRGPARPEQEDLMPIVVPEHAFRCVSALDAQALAGLLAAEGLEDIRVEGDTVIVPGMDIAGVMQIAEMAFHREWMTDEAAAAAIVALDSAPKVWVEPRR